MSSTISLLHGSETIPAVSNTFPTSKIQSIASLTVGEKLEVLVLQGNSGHEVLLQVKDATLKAYSPLPLQSGETLTVRVDQLHPKMILRITLPEDASIFKSNELLKSYRSNPNALREIILSVRDMAGSENLPALEKLLSKEDIQNLVRNLNKIIISKKNVTDAFFIKDSLMALGMGDEQRLYQAISDPSILLGEKNNMTLKRILMKTSSVHFDTSASMASLGHNSLKIEQMIKLADLATRVIESLQIVNFMAMEQDGLFVLHLPFQFHEDIRTQDLYIESDRSAGGKKSGFKYRIVLFLDMDALGQMAIDASYQDKAIRLTMKCSEPYVCEFMQTLSQDLRETLIRSGYSVSGVQCIEDRDSQQWKSEFVRNHTTLSCNVIDVCA
jgi:hypothetical protein